jgi:hypothetical protein
VPWDVCVCGLAIEQEEYPLLLLLFILLINSLLCNLFLVCTPPETERIVKNGGYGLGPRSAWIHQGNPPARLVFDRSRSDRCHPLLSIILCFFRHTGPPPFIFIHSCEQTLLAEKRNSRFQQLLYKTLSICPVCAIVDRNGTFVGRMMLLIVSPSFPTRKLYLSEIITSFPSVGLEWQPASVVQRDTQVWIIVQCVSLLATLLL